MSILSLFMTQIGKHSQIAQLIELFKNQRSHFIIHDSFWKLEVVAELCDQRGWLLLGGFCSFLLFIDRKIDWSVLFDLRIRKI